MGIFYFPCNFVYWRKIEKHNIYKNTIIDFMDSHEYLFDADSLISNGSTTFKRQNEKFSRENKDFIQDVVWNTVDEVINILNSKEDTRKISLSESYITGSWISKYKDNATVAMHEHFSGGFHSPSFSIVYIVKDPNERNTLVFVEPFTQSKSTFGMNEQMFDTSLESEIGEGSVIIFPASLQHRVDLMKKPGRIIMSFNISSTFTNG
jgi:hypothetical protein|tara:strand:+ start:181 stop:801 length:621 start_codon:yes stop_codon:yes gene_type:complete